MAGETIYLTTGMRVVFIFWMLVGLMNDSLGQSARYDSLWNNPAVESRIQAGIEANRKGNFTLVLADKQGKPIRNATVEVQQVRHEFQFGSTLFMLNGFKTDTMNRRFEQVFLSLFTLGCVPFYWKALEPEPGKLRFAASSAPIYRRPPPDAVLDFCRQRNITPKGHTLVWDNAQWSIPDWLPADTAQRAQLIDKRIREIADRYGNSIQTWDIVNELLKTDPAVQLPTDFGLNGFRSAARYFPASTRFLLNEITSVWQNYHREYSPYYLLIQNLLARGAKIDGIGLQFHFFSETLHTDVVAGKAMTPTDLFQTLDLYGRFGKPLHVSEITIPTLPNTDEGQKNQAALTRNFYRLWFSHPAVSAIVWWNMADGTAAGGEDKWRGGFLNQDLSPKPAYAALNDLINTEWKTKLTLQPTGTPIQFRGFYGEYVVRIRRGKQVAEQRVQFLKNSRNEVQLTL